VTPIDITIRCPSCSQMFAPRRFGSGLSCSRCLKKTPPTVQLAQLLDHWWEPRRWRADLHRPNVNFLLEKLWTANGQGEALYRGIGPKYANYSIFRSLVTRAIARGLDEGWMELDFPEDPLADDPVYKLDFKDSDRFAREMEALFPEVDWDETIEVPSGALIPGEMGKSTKPRPKRR
jgi:hypothetical protein